MADPSQLGPDPGTERKVNEPPVVVAAGLPPKLPNKLPPAVERAGELVDKLLELAGGRARPGKVFPGLNKIAISWLAPQPFGVVKPQVFGLPEDYLFGYTPTQIVEAAIQTSPARLAELVAFERRREELSRRLDKIEQQLQLKSKTPLELVQLSVLVAQVDATGGGRSEESIAIQRAFSRFTLDQQLEALNQFNQQQATINDRFPENPQPGEFEWPGGLGSAFIDQLAAMLPPDP